MKDIVTVRIITAVGLGVVIEYADGTKRWFGYDELDEAFAELCVFAKLKPTYLDDGLQVFKTEESK